ncbi:MAG: hypothetical protein HGB05_16265, partial [Chloroflexi bacterium]|nr:hypothetical protein [Chloroflexota bacterium]
MRDTPIDQFIKLNDWLAEHEPDAYHSDEDTATTIIALLTGLRTQLADREHDLAYEFTRANQAETTVQAIEWVGPPDASIEDNEWCPWCGNYR